MNGLDKIRTHPGVESVHDEREYYRGRRSGGCIFVNLRPGYSFDFHARGAGFDTVGEAAAAVRGVYAGDPAY